MTMNTEIVLWIVGIVLLLILAIRFKFLGLLLDILVAVLSVGGKSNDRSGGSGFGGGRSGGGGSSNNW